MALAETARLIASLELKDLFSKQIGNAEKSLGSFDKRLDQTATRGYRAGQQIGNGIKNTAKIIAAAAVTVGTISAGVVAKGIAAASDLSETVSKVGVVFGKQKDAVLAFGKTSAAALGLSENAALSAAATYGNLFVSLGLVPKQSAAMSTALVKLAGDLASFNNVAPEDALEALRSGLTGETEPLKRFGINLNEQTLKAEALKLGLVKLEKGQKNYTAVLTPAQKAQAAYALIMEQSKTAQGDFARTSGGLANQIRILKANFTDMLAAIGSPVLPQVAKVFQRINALIKENQPQVAKLGDAIAGLFTDENLDKGFGFIKTTFDTLKTAAPVLQQSAEATLGIVKTAVGVFKSLPPEIQKLAVGAFAINKITGGLVTNVAGGVFDTLKDLFLKQRGATPVNPLFVADVTGGLGGLAGAAGSAGAAGAAGATGGLGLATIGAGLAAGTAVAALGIMGLGWLITATSTPEQLAQAAANVVADQRNKRTFGRTPYDNSHPLPVAIKGPLTGPAGNVTPDFSRLTGALSGKERDDRDIVKATLRVIGNEFKNIAHTLSKSNKPAEIKNAISEALKLIGSGRGNASATEKVLAGLKAALKRTHDPELQTALRNAIGKVEKVLPGRQFVQKQLDKANAILRSTEKSGQKIKDLQAIEKSLRDRGLPSAANAIRQKIDQAKKEQVYAQHAATQAIKDKDLSVTVPVSITNRVSVAETIKTQTTFAKFGKVYQS